MITRIPLLTPDECGRVLDRVQANRAAWTQRHPALPFFTLGAASYLDSGPRPTDAYRERAAACNPLLERDFGWVYDRLLRAVGRHLQAPAAFAPRAARPGFHIFLAHDAFRRPLGSIHFDLQFAGVDWPDDERVDFSRPVSCTLAVRLPRAGAGLRTWNVTRAEHDAMRPEDRGRIGRERAPTYVPYRAGELICHSGLLLHQMAPASGDIRPDDMRVTLQGHALPGRTGYWLYW